MDEVHESSFSRSAGIARRGFVAGILSLAAPAVSLAATKSADAFDDFSWVTNETAIFDAVGKSYDVPNWHVTLERPASEAQIRRAERQLGVSLPPSLRRFYRRHDGAQLGYLLIASLAALCVDTRDKRVTATSPGAFDGFLFSISFAGASFVALDFGHRDRTGKYPVVELFPEDHPHDWRKTVAASNFGIWLRGWYHDVITKRIDPFRKEPLDGESYSPTYYMKAARVALVRGDNLRARKYVLRGIRGLGMEPELDEAPYLRDGIAILTSIGDETVADRYLRETLLGYELNVATLRRQRGIGFFSGDPCFRRSGFARVMA